MYNIKKDSICSTINSSFPCFAAILDKNETTSELNQTFNQFFNSLHHNYASIFVTKRKITHLRKTDTGQPIIIAGCKHTHTQANCSIKLWVGNGTNTAVRMFCQCGFSGRSAKLTQLNVCFCFSVLFFLASDACLVKPILRPKQTSVIGWT